MLSLLLGGSGTGKTREIYKRIGSSNGNVLFFVPDQFTFEAEKLVSAAFDERTANVKVSGFSALSEEILKKYLPRKSYADSSAKLIIMMRAVRALRGSLRFYGDASGRSGFPSFMLEAAELLKTAGVSPDELLRAAPLSSFGDKLTDICTVCSLYDSMLKELYDDRLDNLVLAARAADEHRCFDGYDVFIDGFDSFSGSQLRFLQPLVTQSKNCCAALTLEKHDKSSCFFSVLKTKRALERFAADGFISVKEEWFDMPDRYKSAELAALQGGLFSDFANAEPPSPENTVFLASAPDAESEADYVCSQIKKLMRKGYKCSDTAVLCAEPQKYLETVKSAFLRYGIPLFADIPAPISEKPLIKYIEALLTAADEPVGENMLRYIKSGFVRIKRPEGGTRPLSLREISDIEEFSDRWDLGKRNWDRPFYKCVTPAEKRVESLRAILTGTLAKLRKACADADGRKLTEELTKFLFDQADISAAIQGKCQDRTTRSLRYDKAMTEEYNSLWEMTSKLLTEIWETTEGMRLTLKEYASLVKTCAAQITMSLPPQVLDSVIFGDPSRTRTTGARAVFVIGVSDGSFPDYSDKNAAVFTRSENAELAKLNINIAQGDESDYSAAQLAVYKALTLPKELLYVTRTAAVGSECEAFTLITDILPYLEDTDISSLPVEFFCESKDSARARLAGTRLTDPSASATVQLALELIGDNEFPELVRRAENAQSDTSYRHSAGSAARLIFRREMLSPTGIELLDSCRFAYFCRYGLKLRPPVSNTINPQSYGETVHYVMKYCFEKIYSGEKPPAEYTSEEIAQTVKNAMDSFLEEKFLPEEEEGRRFSVIYRSIAPLCRMLMTYMRDELENSEFSPKYFELSLKKDKILDDGFKAEPFSLDVPLADGSVRRIGIYGTVDRVDIANAQNGEHWLRVIDYKTGEKDFSVEKVYYGLDLQLLLYLFTLCENNRSFLPSSATYYPAGDKRFGVTEEELDDELKRGLWLENHKEHGFVTQGSQSEKESALYNGRTFDNKTGEIKDKNFFCAKRVSKESLDKIKRRMTELLCENVAAVSEGDVSAVPIAERGSLVSCEYCGYSDVCGRRPDLEQAVRNASGDEARRFKESVTAGKEGVGND